MEADGEFTQFPIGSEGQALGPWQDTSFIPALRQGQVREYLLDGQRQDRRLQSGVYRRLPRAQHRPDATTTRTTRAAPAASTTPARGGGATRTGSTASADAGWCCYSPVTSWHDNVRNTHQSHEIRLSTPDDWRLRGILGAYWEDFEIQDDMNFLYKTIPSCTPANLATALGGGAALCRPTSSRPRARRRSNPGERNDNAAFGEERSAATNRPRSSRRSTTT